MSNSYFFSADSIDQNTTRHDDDVSNKKLTTSTNATEADVYWGYILFKGGIIA